MNGIIDVFAGSIQCDTIDANTIIVDNETINNSLTVENITLAPVEISQLTGINTDETIQQQIDGIETELTNVVTLDQTQTITGAKTFTNTTTQSGVLLLQNNLNVVNTSISPTELSYLDGVTSNIQDQIDSAVVGVTLDTNQVISGFKTFSNGLQTPFIQNQEDTGTVSGYFINTTQLLYTATTGTYTINVSNLTGVDSNNNIITAFDTLGKLVTINQATTPKPAIYVLESYKPNDATTEIFVIGGTGNLAQYQGVQFDTVSDFIDTINTNSFTLLNAASVTSGFIQSIQGYIKNQQLVTTASITLDNFFEGQGLIRPVIYRDQFPVITNQYLLNSPNAITDEPIKSTPSGFIQNNNFWLRTSYSLADGNFVEGSTTTVPLGSQIISENANSYQYTIAVANSPSYLTRTGFVASSVLRIYDTTGIVLLTGVYNTTDNNGEYGFVNAINANNTIGFIKGVVYPQTFTTLNAYIDSNLNLICLTNNVGKFSPLDTITRVDSVVTQDVYNISSPNPIAADIPSKTTKGYKYDANTLILESTVNNEFFFEFTNLPVGSSNQKGSFSSDFNTHYCSVINSGYVTPTKSGTFKFVIRPVSGGFHIFWGGYTAVGTNDFVVNATLAPLTSCCRIELPIYNPNFVYNSTQVEALENSLTTSTALISQTSYAIMLNLYYVFENNSGLAVNDILIKNTSNQLINGRNIISQPGVGNCVNVLAQNYIEQVNIPSRASNKNWSKNKTSPIVTATQQYNAQSQPQVGNFVICNNPNFIAGRITSIATVGANYELTISPNPSTGALVTGSDLFIYTAYGTMDIYRPVDFDVYESTDVTAYTQTQDFYQSKSYKFYNQETNNVFENRTYDEFQNTDSNIFSNNTYTIDTTVQLDLPNSGVQDTFVLENFAQNLSQKTFTDDTAFQADITVTNDVNCQYLNVSRDITCRDIDGIGTLTMSSQTKEHALSNVYIGRQFSTTSDNYGISIGASQTDSSNFILTKNVSNNIVVMNSTAEVWANINNSLRLKVADQSIEFYPAGNLRFSSGNASTRLYQTNAISGADVFANDTDVYMDFFTQNKDYDVRFQFKRRNANNGDGWFDCFAYRGRFYYGTQKMLEWGYINSANSFLMGASGSTWIQFNTNTEIYYQINGANRMTAASNGYHYATLHVNTSDERLKSNIVDVSNALQTINTIEVKEFDKKCSMCCDDDDCDEEISHEIGFIAQQIEETDISFCVTTTQLNDTKGLKDSCIFSLNVRATQELYEMVKQQQELLQQQQEEINSLKERLSYLNV
jgi:hypothetical protein